MLRTAIVRQDLIFFIWSGSAVQSENIVYSLIELKATHNYVAVFDTVVNPALPLHIHRGAILETLAISVPHPTFTNRPTLRMLYAFWKWIKSL